MKVRDLIVMLQQQSPEADVIIPYHSDYDFVASVEPVQAVNKGFYVMRVHPTFVPTAEEPIQPFVLLDI